MADAGVLKAGDRLPWLEPYRAPEKPQIARRSVHLIAAAAVALAGGSSLLVMREQPAPADPVEASRSVVALPTPADMQPEAVAPPIEMSNEQPIVVRPTQAVEPVKRRWRPAPRRRIVSAGPERDAFETIMSEQIGNAVLPPPAPVIQPVVAPPPPPRPVVNPSAQVVRGKTAQLGVYLSARQAEAAWQSAIRDYTFLVTMPKSIEPIRIRSKRYYRLQLGTPSKRHARELCSNLRATGRACTVA